MYTDVEKSDFFGVMNVLFSNSLAVGSFFDHVFRTTTKDKLTIIAAAAAHRDDARETKSNHDFWSKRRKNTKKSNACFQVSVKSSTQESILLCCDYWYKYTTRGREGVRRLCYLKFHHRFGPGFLLVGYGAVNLESQSQYR